MKTGVFKIIVMCLRRPNKSTIMHIYKTETKLLKFTQILHGVDPNSPHKYEEIKHFDNRQ